MTQKMTKEKDTFAFISPFSRTEFSLISSYSPLSTFFSLVTKLWRHKQIKAQARGRTSAADNVDICWALAAAAMVYLTIRAFVIK